LAAQHTTASPDAKERSPDNMKDGMFWNRKERYPLKRSHFNPNEWENHPIIDGHEAFYDLHKNERLYL
jgi:hypothetical protein